MFIPEELYRQIVENAVISTVDLLFLNSKNQLFLCYRNNEPLKDIYYIPGGRINKGEPMIQAACRKAKDEVGLDIDPTKLQFLGVYDDLLDNSTYPGVSSHYIPVTYVYRLSQQEEQHIGISDDQHSGHKFFDSEDNSLHPMVKKRIEDMKHLGYIYPSAAQPMIKLIKSSFLHEQETKDRLCEFIQQAAQFSIGQHCNQFEDLFAKRQGKKYCRFFNSGSSANLALIQAMLNMGKLQKGDKVGFSALTRATDVMPIIQLGLTPVPLDIELDTLNVSLRTVQQVQDLKCVFITNLLGRCDNIDEIAQYCEANSILLLEDNCESMGTVYKGKKLGSYGFASTFSTYVGHHISTIEGGLVCTDDEELYTMLCMVRAHGRDRNLDAERQNAIRKKYDVDGTFFAKYTFYTLGYNLRPNEVTGFLGCQQMKYIDEIVAIREQNAKRFVATVNANDDFHPLRIDHMELFSNFAIPVVCNSKETFELYRAQFESQGVEIRPIVGGDLTQQPFWKDLYGESNQGTNAKKAHEYGFYFGNSPEYTEQEIQILLELLQKPELGALAQPDIIARREGVGVTSE
ncbi:MAG: DegT/DnrJ/EryC1/StrS family aminotransferase [Candidatus Absconditabacterales bacterium]